MKGKKDKVVAIVPAAGLGKRFGEEKNKPFYPLMEKPLLIWSLETLQGVEEIAEIIPVLKEDDLITCGELIEKYNITKVKRIVPGGQERQDSVYNAIKILDNKTDVVLIHDGVRPLVEGGLIRRSIAGLKNYDGVVAGVPVKDTIKSVKSRESRVKGQETEEDIVVEKTLNRNTLWAIQTPQVFCYEKIKDAYGKAMADKYYATDDAALIEGYGGKIKIIMGSYTNIKITMPEDIIIAEALLKACMRIGIGYDSHRLVEGKRLIIGGVDIPFEKGLLGHSDGDVLCHAIIDAIIGATGEGDIGKHFPDTDNRYKDASSIMFLKHIVELSKSKGFEILWIDSIIITERPKIAPHIDAMKSAISQAGIPPEFINIKAKTNEGMGFVGRGEGIAVQAVCLLRQAQS